MCSAALQTIGLAGMGILNEFKNGTYAWWRSDEVTIAVAGLSRSGKTAFITSMIANLEAASYSSAGQKWLNGFGVVDTARLNRVRKNVFRRER
jgi:predicted YcjX-like family ATPase